MHAWQDARQTCKGVHSKVQGEHARARGASLGARSMQHKRSRQRRWCRRRRVVLSERRSGPGRAQRSAWNSSLSYWAIDVMWAPLASWTTAHVAARAWRQQPGAPSPRRPHPPAAPPRLVDIHTFAPACCMGRRRKEAALELAPPPVAAHDAHPAQTVKPSPPDRASSRGVSPSLRPPPRGTHSRPRTETLS